MFEEEISMLKNLSDRILPQLNQKVSIGGKTVYEGDLFAELGHMAMDFMREQLDSANLKENQQARIITAVFVVWASSLLEVIKNKSLFM